MWEHQNLMTDNEYFDERGKVLSMMLCNVRSLRKHVTDIKEDLRFLAKDLILCTETQLTNNEQCDISIENFTVLCNNSSHKYSSIAAYCNTDCNLEEEFQVNGASIFKITTDSIDIKLLLLYGKSEWEIRTFYEFVQYLSIANEVDFIMGDFNLKPNVQLDRILSEYNQLVTEPTHIAGSMLDHAYVKKSFLSKYDVKLFVKSVFFTDHEAIDIRIGQKINK